MRRGGGGSAGDMAVTPAKGGSVVEAGRKGSAGGDAGGEKDAKIKRQKKKKKERGAGVKKDDTFGDAASESASAPVAGLVFSKDGKCILATWLNKVLITGQNAPRNAPRAIAPPQSV